MRDKLLALDKAKILSNQKQETALEIKAVASTSGHIREGRKHWIQDAGRGYLSAGKGAHDVSLGFREMEMDSEVSTPNAGKKYGKGTKVGQHKEN